MDYLDDEERELIESIEGAPHFGERLDPEEENRFRELLKVATRRKPKDTKITLRIASDDLVASPASGAARPSVHDTAAAPIIRNPGKAIDAARGPQVQCGAWTSPTRSTTWCSST